MKHETVSAKEILHRVSLANAVGRYPTMSEAVGDGYTSTRTYRARIVRRLITDGLLINGGNPHAYQLHITEAGLAQLN